jgi:hypothetical protein
MAFKSLLIVKKKLTFIMTDLREKVDLVQEYRRLQKEDKLDKHSIRTYKDMIYFRDITYPKWVGDRPNLQNIDLDGEIEIMNERDIRMSKSEHLLREAKIKSIANQQKL